MFLILQQHSPDPQHLLLKKSTSLVLCVPQLQGHCGTTRNPKSAGDSSTLQPRSASSYWEYTSIISNLPLCNRAWTTDSESQNGLVWRDLKDHLVQIPWRGQGHLSQTRVAQSSNSDLENFHCVGEWSDGLNTFFFKVFLCHGFYLRCCHVGAESQEGEKIICSA